MREFRGDGGREAKADPEFRVDWKGERESSNNNSNVRTERKDGREHRGGGAEGREAGGRRDGRESRGGAAGDTARERKSEELRGQESGESFRDWTRSTFPKSSSTAVHGEEEEGEIGEFAEDGGAEQQPSSTTTTTTRFEEVKRKRDDREPRVSSNSSTITEREERQREKSERRGGGGVIGGGGGGGGDLQVHISFASSSQREKEREKEKADREEKGAEREKEVVSSKQKAKDKEDSSPVVVVAKEKGGGKESDVDSRREKESDGYTRRKEAVDQDDKDQNTTTAITTERAEKQQQQQQRGDFEESVAVGTSAAGVRNAEDALKIGGEAEGKERAEGKEAAPHEKGKIEVGEEEKGKRKLRDYDRAGAGADEVNNANNHATEGEDFEREVVSSYGIPKRLLRPRGHYQGSNTREVRPRFRPKDPETYPPVRAPENSALAYRVGEGGVGLQEELRRIRKEFEEKAGKLPAEQQISPTIEVRIPAELASTSNRQVQGSQLWGTDVYTDDSDLVAVLMHTGYYSPTASSPPAAVLELRATVRVLPPRDKYTATLRNSLRSRAWGSPAASGCAFSVESCSLVKKDGSKIQLEPRLTFTPAFAPTLAPAVSERTVTTRAVSMNAYRAQRFTQEVTIQYNLCNEPWLKYSMNIVADKGLKKSQYTSARLKKSDVLYVETHFKRYELSYEDTKTGTLPSLPPGETVAAKTAVEKGKDKADVGDKGLEKAAEKGVHIPAGSSKEMVEKAGNNNHHNGPVVVGDRYRWALCIKPLPLQTMRGKGVPLPLECLKVLESGLGWEEVQWSPAGVCVRGKEYPLARAQFLSQHE